MNFEERVNIEIAEKLSLMSMNQFLELYKIGNETFELDDIKTIDNETKTDIEGQYTMIISYCKEILNNNNKLNVNYGFSNDLTFGRLQAKTKSLQRIYNGFRGVLCNGLTFDLDMCNCHIKILIGLCKKHNIDCYEVEKYDLNRETHLNSLMVLLNISKKDAKQLYLKSINKSELTLTYGKHKKIIKDKSFLDFDKQTSLIIDKLYNIYENDFKIYINENDYNFKGKLVNRVLLKNENELLNKCIDFLKIERIEISTLMFDGLMIYKGDFNKYDLLNKINELFKTENIEWTFKKHNLELLSKINSFTFDNEVDYNSFEKMTKEFEKEHCKITNLACFIKKSGDDIILMKEAHLITAYKQLKYQEINPKNNILESKKFINEWLNYEKMRNYEKIDCFPNGTKCPDNVFNTWSNFEMENVIEYSHKQEELDFILNFIKKLCNNNDEHFQYFIKWIAQMIQYPAIKSGVLPVLISKQGAGKGTFITLIKKMLGEKKFLESANPSRDVWGTFNNLMTSAFFVNLNEVGKKDMEFAEGIVKNLITDSTIPINTKNVSAYDAKSYHRFLITTNKEEPVNTSKDDRRNFIIRCSDELIDNKPYFDKMQLLLSDVNVIKTCYEYFKSIPDMNKFHSLKKPVSEYQENLRELSLSPIEHWLKAFTLENINEDRVELLATETLEYFNKWCSKNGIKYDMTSIKLGLKLVNMNIKGILKGNHTMKGNTKFFDIKLLKEHFEINTDDLVDFIQNEN
jgi:hypothetical protein